MILSKKENSASTCRCVAWDSLHGGVDVVGLGLEEAQDLFALRDQRGESHQSLQRQRTQAVIF